ncbi:MAG: ParA family protein [Calditrichaeota bacterium]|nr:ParA family protein [Calditrichota bacterium]MCB0266804.1 ParA family protein [Calditrichota bacterium]
MGKIIAVANPKGGVGKTTTVINLAASLAIAEKTVLIIDCDPSGSISQGLGVPQYAIKHGIFDVFSGSAGFIEAIQQVEFFPQFDILPAGIREHEQEIRLMELAKNRVRMKRLLNGLMTSGRLNYDYILIDTPPSMDDLALGAMYAADSVLIPLQSGFYAINAAERLLGMIERIRKTTNPNLNIEGILLTFSEKGTRATNQALSAAEERFGNLMFDTQIPKNAALGYAAFARRPIALVDVTAPGAQAYLALAEEIIHKNRQIPVYRATTDSTAPQISYFAG